MTAPGLEMWKELIPRGAVVELVLDVAAIRYLSDVVARGPEKLVALDLAGVLQIRMSSTG